MEKKKKFKRRKRKGNRTSGDTEAPQPTSTINSYTVTGLVFLVVVTIISLQALMSLTSYKDPWYQKLHTLRGHAKKLSFETMEQKLHTLRGHAKNLSFETMEQYVEKLQNDVKKLENLTNSVVDLKTKGIKIVALVDKPFTTTSTTTTTSTSTSTTTTPLPNLPPFIKKRTFNTPLNNQKVVLKKYDNFVKTVLDNYDGATSNIGRITEAKDELHSIHQHVDRILSGGGSGNSVHCLYRNGLLSESVGSSSKMFNYHAPAIHSKQILHSYRMHKNSWYREVGEKLSIYNGHVKTNTMKEGELIDHMLLEPYDQAIVKKEPTPAICIFENAAVDVNGNLCNIENKCLRTKACIGSYGNYRSATTNHDVIYSIAEQWGEGFYHFIAENYLRLFIGLDYLLSDLGKKTKIYVTRMSTFVAQALDLLGIPANRILERSGRRAKVVLFPEPVGCGSPAKMMVQLGRSEIFTRVVGTSLKPLRSNGKLIITIIKRTGSREVSNHQELVSALQEKYKPIATVYEFVKENMMDSVRTFENTDILIGPHGAGLSNMLYMHPDRGILEMMVVGKDVNACYMYMALKLGLRYHTWGDPKATQNGKMTANIDEINNIVKMILDKMNMINLVPGHH
jgi:HPt (histidine-containing phosphotransfer) domain-containing protein